MNTYTVDINGIPHTMQLSDDDAERYGVKVKAAPKNKAVTVTASKLDPVEAGAAAGAEAGAKLDGMPRRGRPPKNPTT